MPGMSCHVHLPHEEADVVSRDDLVMEALCGHSLASKYSHFDDCPSPCPKLLLCQLNLISPHNPVRLALWYLAQQSLENILKHSIRVCHLLLHLVQLPF